MIRKQVRRYSPVVAALTVYVLAEILVVSTARADQPRPQSEQADPRGEDTRSPNSRLQPRATDTCDPADVRAHKGRVASFRPNRQRRTCSQIAAALAVPGARVSHPASDKDVSCSNFVLDPVPMDAFELHVVGVYEPLRIPDGRPARSMRPIDVQVERTAKPVVLALTSYEPVEWRIRTTPGAAIAAVIVAGYHRQTVSWRTPVRSNTPVYMVGRDLCRYPYQWEASDSGRVSEFAVFQSALEEYSGLTVKSFNGCYTGREFVVPHAHCPMVSPARQVFGDETLDNRQVRLTTCRSTVRESAWCVARVENLLTLVGADSGRICSTPYTVDQPGGAGAGLLWRGEVVYLCSRKGITRLSLRDGNSERLNVGCEDIEFDPRTGKYYLYVGAANGLTQQWFAYDSFDDIRSGRGRPVGGFGYASRFALHDGVVFGAWHSTDSLVRTAVTGGKSMEPVALGGYDGWVHGLSVTDKSILWTTNDGLMRLDRKTREARIVSRDRRLAAAPIACTER